MKETQKNKKKQREGGYLDFYSLKWRLPFVVTLELCVIVLKLGYSLPKSHIILMSCILIWLITLTFPMESASIPHALSHYINGSPEFALLIHQYVVLYIQGKWSLSWSFYNIVDLLCHLSMCQLYWVILSLHRHLLVFILCRLIGDTLRPSFDISTPTNYLGKGSRNQLAPWNFQSLVAGFLKIDRVFIPLTLNRLILQVFDIN
jgi:hypothetical protein